MIANIIYFYGGGITIDEAERMPLSKLDRYLILITEIQDTQKKAINNGL